MNKALNKNLQDIDRNKNIKSGVCKCYWSGDLWLSVGEKSHFEKMAFKKICIAIEIHWNK